MSVGVGEYALQGPLTMMRDQPDSVKISLENMELSHLLAQVGESVLQVDMDWVVTYCNDTYAHSIGLSRSDIIGRTPFEYLPSFDRSIFFDAGERCLRDRHPETMLAFSVMRNTWVLARVFPIESGMVVLANQASEGVVEQYQLAQGALKDPLTTLPNKLALMQELKARLKGGEPFTLAVLGLNRFKSVNDSQGFAQGDLALMEMASYLHSGTVAGERLYRLNSDEFALLTQGEEAMACGRVRNLSLQAQRPIVLNGQVFVLGAAAGVVHAPQDGTDAEVLLKRAVLALREAKRTNPDEVVAYQPKFEAALLVRAELEAELRRAVEGEELMLMLQPKGCLTGRHLVGAEALVRWQHPTRGMVPPFQFLPLAEECGLMPAIDRWVLRHALGQIGELKQRGLAVPVSINVSVQSLADLGFVQSVREALAQTGIEPELLDVEIPEGALMHDVTASAAVLVGLHELGVGISIDDFGTGYSSFAYLARFPVQTLKVDRSFVIEMTTNEASRRIVEGLVSLAHSLSMRVVAEGAETEEQLAMLQAMGCDEVQGYGYARPLPFEAFCEFAREHRL